MSQGSPTKQPWSRPALYPAALRGEEATEGWKMERLVEERDLMWQRVMEEEKRRRGNRWRGTERVDR